MVAATRMITKEDALNSIAKHRGRPTKLTTAELIAGVQRHDSYRKAVNQKYAITGLSMMAGVIGEEETRQRFMHPNRILYQGVFEQFGRCDECGVFTDEELFDLAETILKEIGEGIASREIESRLRQLRLLYVKARTERGQS